jgi:hypothetical protein
VCKSSLSSYCIEDVERGSSGLRRHLVLYMVASVLEEHNYSFNVKVKMKMVYSSETLVSSYKTTIHTETCCLLIILFNFTNLKLVE